MSAELPVRYGYGECRRAVLQALAEQGEMTTADVVVELGLSTRRAGDVLQRLADAGEIHVPRRVGRAHVWALAKRRGRVA